MNIGSAVILTLFLAHILRYFGYTKKGLAFRFLPYFEMHPKLFFIGLFYTAALYMPNFIIWLGPDGILIDGTYRCAPTYDVATFFAFLSIMPVMVMFTVSAELNFYERYAVYFTYITKRGNFRDIEDARIDLLRTLWYELRNIVEFRLYTAPLFRGSARRASRHGRTVFRADCIRRGRTIFRRGQLRLYILPRICYCLYWSIPADAVFLQTHQLFCLLRASGLLPSAERNAHAAFAAALREKGRG